MQIFNFRKFVNFIVFIALPLSGGVGGGLLSSCSETEGVESEFADWQTKNETFFDGLYNDVKQGKKGADWKVVRNWSMPADSELGYAERSRDCIVVNVLKSGEGTECPLYTDSVRCHYEGRLIPSLSYTDGYKFDSSYEAPFLEDRARPVKFLTSGLVDGFTTALMNMHVGDHWRVYIPYQLGYGTTQSSGSAIPAYSTLVFEIRLTDFWH